MIKTNINKPLILNLTREKDKKIFKELKKMGVEIVDKYDLLLQELNKCSPKQSIKRIDDVWIYYPWHQKLVHSLSEPYFYLIKTSRNLGLITKSEQKNIKNFRIGIVGLNVGNPLAMALAFQGFTKFKIADNDTFELSNLNRLAAGLKFLDVGENKTILCLRHIYDINPFCEVIPYPEGISEKNLVEFLVKPKVDILVEEIDNLVLKIKIRELAKKYRIPVIMATGNESDVILDIERYDLNPRLKILNGFLNDETRNKILNLDKLNLTEKEKILLIRNFIGSKFLSSRLNKSFMLLSKKMIRGIPQLSEVSFLRAAVLTLVIKQFALRKKIESGRYIIKISNFRETRILI